MENSLQLVNEAKKGNAEAFAQLYQLVYQDLYRFALYTLRNSTDAEDAVSDTVVDAFASIRKLRSADAFRAWIFRILSNKCKNKLREYTRKQIEWKEEIDDTAIEENFTEGVLIRKVFRQLSYEERLIISMHVFGGYTSKEIAKILHKNHNTIRTKESRALRKMALWLEE